MEEKNFTINKKEKKYNLLKYINFLLDDINKFSYPKIYDYYTEKKILVFKKKLNKIQKYLYLTNNIILYFKFKQVKKIGKSIDDIINEK
jgi:hypothetical protein